VDADAGWNHPEFMVPFHVKDAVKMRQDAPNPDNSKESEMP
jgi:hypothetical protein